MTATGPVAVLEPRGTYTEEAAMKLFPGVECAYFSTPAEIIGAVDSGKIEVGVVPIENSIEGSVGEVLYALLEKGVHVCGEVVLKIRHCLLAPPGAGQIRVILSHPQAIAQCKGFLKRNYPDAELRFSSSTAQAAKAISLKGVKGTAAIASRFNASYYGLGIIKEGIEDSRTNETRFIAVCKGPLATGKKASVILALRNKPGALHEILGEFAGRGINLVRIESRPSQKKLGEYVFFVDFETKGSTEGLLDSLREHALWLKDLGSY